MKAARLLALTSITGLVLTGFFSGSAAPLTIGGVRGGAGQEQAAQERAAQGAEDRSRPQASAAEQPQTEEVQLLAWDQPPDKGPLPRGAGSPQDRGSPDHDAPAGGSLDAPIRARLLALLPGAGQVVTLMQWQPSFSVVALRKRVTEVGGDQRLLDEVTTMMQRGLSPSYDARLGISRAEFQRFVVFQSILVPSDRTTRLNVGRDSLHLSFGDSLGASILKGLTLDLNSGELKTPEGFGARPQPVSVSADNDVIGLGARSGFTWVLKASSPTTLNALDGRLSLLQLSDGSVVLSYSRVSILKGHVSDAALNVSYRK